MSQVTETICDQCGVRKNKANHWFISVQTKNGISFYNHYERATDCKDLCSQGCVMRALSDFLDRNNMMKEINLPE